MKKNSTSFVVAAFLLATVWSGSSYAGLFSFLKGKDKGPVCQTLDSKVLSQSISDAKEALSKPECYNDFDRYFKGLISYAAGSPKKENKQVFYDFIKWSVNNGVISEREGKIYFTRYFGYKFTSVMGDYNICTSVCAQDGGTQVLGKIKRELDDKRTGLLKVCNDKAAFAQANQLHDEVELVLYSTCDACNYGEEQYY